MKNWRKEMAEQTQQFRKEAEGGLAFGVRLFDTARGLPELMKLADKGDREAQRICMAFVDWAKRASEASKDRVSPGCFACKQEVLNGDVAAIGYVEPIEAGGTISLIMVMCGTCRDTLSFDEVLAKLDQCIEQELDGVVETVSTQ